MGWLGTLPEVFTGIRPSERRPEKGGCTVCRRRALSVVVLAAALLALPLTASAGLTLNYEGSLKMPTRSSAPKEYYARGAAFAPTGTPVLGGGSLTEPSLLVGYSWHQNTVEYTKLPTPAKTPAALAAALTAVTGTTVVDRPADNVLGDVDSAGNMWDTDQYTSGGGHPGAYSDPGVHMLGATSLSSGRIVQETGWPAGWAGTVCLRRGDGAGNDLPSDGTTVGAKFLYVQRTHADGESAYVYEVTRSDATTVSSTLLFKRSTGDFNTTDQFVQYVRDTSGAEYIMLSYEQGHSGDSHVLEFYDPATAIGGALNPAPAYSLDIGPDIAAGAGWMNASSVVGATAVDWANSQLYVVDGRYKDVRIHVFTAQGPVARPVAEPGVLGLTLLGVPLLLRSRKRGARMSKRWMSWFGLAMVALLLAPMAAQAVPSYQMRTNPGGIPRVLIGNAGYGSFEARWLTISNDGYVSAYDTSNYGNEFHVLNPALHSPNNAATSAEVALVQVWDNNAARDGYEASASTGVHVAAANCGSGLARAIPDGGFFTYTGGGTFSWQELRYEDSTTGAYDVDSGSAGRRGAGSKALQTGLHKQGIDWVGSPAADTYQVFIGLRSLTSQGLVKSEWGPLTGLNTGSPPAAGSRVITAVGNLIGGSGNTRGSLMADLVVGISDSVNDFAYNPADGRLYFISNYDDGSQKHVYLSAIDFAWGNLADNTTATYADLDPDAATTYLDIAYDSGDAAPDMAGGYGLTFSPDGSVLYVSNSTVNRVFIFDKLQEAKPVAEPAGLGLLGLALLGIRRKRS